ncbi:MAG: YtxH domain-containing protein [Candidatus Paceibacterota bacterium]|jgi:gas vesicle protein
MPKKITPKKSSLGAAVGIGVGIAAATAAAYLLFGPDGKKNRKAISGWTIKMKGEIIEKFEKAKEVTEPIYHEIVDEVSKKYSKLKNIDKEDLEAVVDDLKNNWNKIVKDVKSKKKK